MAFCLQRLPVPAPEQIAALGFNPANLLLERWVFPIRNSWNSRANGADL